MNRRRGNRFEEQGSYQRLAEAKGVQARPLVAVVGSGASAPSIPSWGGLYTKLLEELEEAATRSQDLYTRHLPDIEELEKAESYWSKFEILKRAMPAAYHSIIRSTLAKSETADIPKLHSAVWDLPISGVVSLNLDSFARRAAMSRHRGKELKLLKGAEAGRIPRILHQPHPFLYELHGVMDDELSWVFTQTELNRLYSSPRYSAFLEAIYSDFHVVFFGVSADDIAIGGPLLDLATRNIQTPDHFWVTSRSDSEALDWADRARVERIEYEPGEHEQVLEVIKALSKAIPKEESPSPVARRNIAVSTTIRPASDLVSLPVDAIRDELNSHAKYLLGQEDPGRYEQFLAEYDEAIDRAWYMPIDPTGHRMFEYVLHGAASEGAFGSVYQAVDKEGRRVAIKVLKRDIRRNTELLQGFRRGVGAMRILGERGIPGMVSHLDSSEIPTFVTMDWIDGPTLSQAKESRLLESWDDILDIAIKIARIVLSAHRLPEKVLHRDLRPANIMLRDGWTEVADWDVVVLDFDLATYKHAKQQSVLANDSALGYLAPEQFSESRTVSSRNALVDSFGFGMTLFYLAGGEEPDANLHRMEAFALRVRSAVNSIPPAGLASAARRVERIILNSTRERQGDRWGVELILNELQKIQDANQSSRGIRDNELFAEEIANYCPIMSDRYEWTTSDSARYGVANGPVIEIRPLRDRLVEVELNWADDGSHERKGMHKFVAKRVEGAEDRLKRAGWSITEKKGGRGVMRVVANVDILSGGTPEVLGRSVGESADYLTFN